MLGGAACPWPKVVSRPYPMWPSSCMPHTQGMHSNFVATMHSQWAVVPPCTPHMAACSL